MSELAILETPSIPFPDPENALESPNGLLAVGGQLTPSRLLEAYKKGIFPWYDEDQPILWWSPDPRAVLLPHAIITSRNLRKRARQNNYQIKSNTAFDDVIRKCATSHGEETWISEEMIEAYQELHRLGFAHSVEIWIENELAGGLYGVAVGGVFSGESMFYEQADASKLAFLALHDTLFAAGFTLIDCQIPNPHLSSLGVQEISRAQYLQLLNTNIEVIDWPTTWSIGLSKTHKASSFHV